jgi:hypothetical protein
LTAQEFFERRGGEGGPPIAPRVGRIAILNGVEMNPEEIMAQKEETFQKKQGNPKSHRLTLSNVPGGTPMPEMPEASPSTTHK